MTESHRQRLVVVGGGQAAFSFAEKARALLPDADITIVCDEPVLPYQRPPLSKKYMTGELERESLTFRTADWFAQQEINVLKGRRVCAIDRSAQTVSIEGDGQQDEQTLVYDKLMLATGSRARPFPHSMGGDLEGVYLMRNIADADALAPELKAGGKVVVIGGGYIGLEAASVARKAGMDVTIVEASQRILQRVASAETSDWFRQLHMDHGVSVYEAAQVEGFMNDDGRAVSVLIQDRDGTGHELPADVILVGIGIIPNLELAENAGIAVDNGIAVDARARTSDPDIFAAGDCASFEFQGTRIRLESVQNAIEQAQCAAMEIAGQGADYSPVPWFWSEQYDTMLQIAGLNAHHDQIVVREGSRDGSISHWYFREGEFISVDAMNEPRAYLPGKKLLELGRAITPEQAGNPNFDLKTLMRG
ncbi:MAG: FAD/NAD(P)-binding oxidoreductase [Pseudomonadota bacterium]